MPDLIDRSPPPALSSPLAAAAVEVAVRFLEADPTFDGADDVKEKLAGQLLAARLSPDERNRLAAVLLRALRHGPQSVFLAYARLAPVVTTPIVEAAVTCYVASCEYPVADRAKHVLGLLRGETAQFYLDSRPHLDTLMLRSRRDFTVAAVHGARETR